MARDDGADAEATRGGGVPASLCDVRRRLVTGGLAVIAIVVVVLAIRSWSTDEGDRARASVERFAGAVESRDYRTICSSILADDLQKKIEQLNVPCERAMEASLGRVQQPRLSIQNVVVVDDRARAAVRTEAAGQRPSADVLSLERQDGSWRISELNQTASTESTGSDTGTPAPAQTVITTPAPVQGDLTPDTSKLPDDARIQDRNGKGKTAAEKRRDARLRALQRRALRVQGGRGEQ